MKKIIKLTESELKEIIGNIITEEKYDISKDPKALVLLDYLTSTLHTPTIYLMSPEEAGLASLKYLPSTNPVNPDSYEVEGFSYYVLTDEELDYHRSFRGEWSDSWRITKRGKYNIVD